MTAVLFVSAAAGAIVVPIPTLPSVSIVTLIEPAVKNSNLSSSDPAETSARIKVSWSTSLTPPRVPHSLPAP